jgi:hypothetical protein
MEIHHDKAGMPIVHYLRGLFCGIAIRHERLGP